MREVSHFMADIGRARSARRVVPMGVAALMLAWGLTAAAPAAAQTEREKKLEQRINKLEQDLRLIRNQMKRLNEEGGGREGRKRYVKSGNRQIQLTISGQVNRAVQLHATSNYTNVFHVDNNASSSRLRLRGRGRVTADIAVLSQIEIEYQSNPSNKTNGVTDGAVEDFNIRKAEVWFDSFKWGRLWIGKGSTAGDLTTEKDLSGTSLAIYSGIGATFGGALWNNDMGTYAPSTGALTVATFFNNMDGTGRRNRIRYDTPNFYGFRVYVSHQERQVSDIAVHYFGNPFGWKDLLVAAGFNYTYFPALDNNGSEKYAIRRDPPRNQASGSISMLHVPTGVSLTFAAGRQWIRDYTADPARKPQFWYVKLGYQTQHFSFGGTYLAVDFARHDNITMAGDHATAVGFGIVQKIDRAATELYFSYRYHQAYRRPTKLPGSITELKPVHGLQGGARVKF